MFVELSGVDLVRDGQHDTFLELGFDSLFLTQVAQALQEKFGVKVTFRQLLNDVSSLNALTEFVASNLPPDTFGEPARWLATGSSSAATIAPATSAHSYAQAGPQEIGAAASEGSIERLMREQLQAMNQLFAQATRSSSRSRVQARARRRSQCRCRRRRRKASSSGADAGSPVAAEQADRRRDQGVRAI